MFHSLCSVLPKSFNGGGFLARFQFYQPKRVFILTRLQGRKRVDLRRAWERVGEEEWRLQEREPRAIGEAAEATGVQARAQGTPRRAVAQAVAELQRALADIRRRLE